MTLTNYLKQKYPSLNCQRVSRLLNEGYSVPEVAKRVGSTVDIIRRYKEKKQ